MNSSSVPSPNHSTVRRHLEVALAESTEPEVRFHLRQALQLVS
ncbi:hypothetical protein [Salinigranum halophilum]|jgi:hypothetical protein|nr:hypothetical protein [Salinigranum halophilum]